MLLPLSCAHTKKERPTVEELFKQALENSRARESGPSKEALKSLDRTEDGETFRPESVIRNWFVRAWSLGSFDGQFSHASKSEGRQKRASDVVRRRNEQDGPRVTSTFNQTQIRQALRALANQAGVNVVIDRQVQGLVSAIIDQEPFEEALQRLLLPLGLVYRKVGERYYVGVPDPSSSLYSLIAVQQIYHVQELSPKKLYELLPERLKKFVRKSGQQQALIIEAPKRIATEIQRRVQKVDDQVNQVVIEAIVAVFAPDTRFRFGLDVSQGIQVRGNDFINVMMQDLNLSGQYGPPQFNDVRNFSFTSAFLQALAEEGYLTIRAAPRVMARDGQQAKIRIGRQTFFSTVPNVEDTQFFSQEIRDVQSGIVLDMEPTVRGEKVLIDLQNAEVSEEIRTTQRNNDFPVINRRKVSTTVEVGDGSTIVIGGLVQRTVIDQRAEIPRLAGIPLMGYLFSDVDRQTKKREIAIFLSPRIVER